MIVAAALSIGVRKSKYFTYSHTVNSPHLGHSYPQNHVPIKGWNHILKSDIRCH